MTTKLCVFVSGVCVDCGAAQFNQSQVCGSGAKTLYFKSDVIASGPGAELSRLLKRLGIEPTPTCSCRAKAAQMDAWGPDECSRPERIEEVVAVMREEAAARGLPFIDAVGRMLVKRAIHIARKATLR